MLYRLFSRPSVRRPDRKIAKGHKVLRSPIESLESRTLLSVSASAQIALVSTTGTGPSTIYNYDITVNNTGTTNVGTFWFAWIPGGDFLPTVPTAASDPTGWGHTLTGAGNSSDGTAIEWVASSNAIASGHSLSGFDFSSHDSPAVLAANAPSFPSEPTLTAFVYSGGPFSDAGFQFTVAQTPTTAASQTALQTSNPSVIFGTPVTFTATVTSASGTGATPTGTVDFKQDGNDLGTAPVQPDGTAGLTLSSLPVGTDHITATYGGDSNYSSSPSNTVTETVTAANVIGTATTLISSSPTAVGGTSVQFTATVTPDTNVAALTGTVDFTADGNDLGSVAVGSDGTAILTTSTLPVGDSSIVATYSGDGNYAASASNPLTQTITQPPTLVPLIGKTKLPTAVVADTPVKGTVTVEVSNQLGSLIKGPGTVQLFVTTGDSIDSSATMVAQVVKSFNLKPGKTTPLTLHLNGSLPTGSLTFFTRVIDPSGNVNDSTAGPAVIAAPPFVSLSETVTSNKLPTAAIAGDKARGSITVSITNNGNVITPNITTIELAATTDGQVDGSAVNLVTLAKKLSIKPGKTARVTLSLKQIPLAPNGDYILVIQATDGDGQVTSVAAGSSLTIAPPFVALSETVASNKLPVSATGGAKASGSVTLNITNNGNVVTPNLTTIELAATTDGEVDGSAISLVTLAKKLSIKPGKTTRVTLSLKALPVMPIGTYTLVIQVTDGDGQVTSVTLGTLTITA